MFQKVLTPLKEQATLINLVAVCFAVSLLAGIAVGQSGSAFIASWRNARGPANYEQVEAIFGPFREPVRSGSLTAIAACILIVFSINLVAAISKTVSTVFVLPLALHCFGWWTIGLGLSDLQGTSWLSIVLFLLVAGLEWVTYILSVAAGLNVAYGIVAPARVNCISRWSAFKRSCAQTFKLYVLIVAVLTMQATLEVLYVRKVLLMGGTGVPLAPW